MIDLGHYNTLQIARHTSVGLFLTDHDGNDVLLPNKFVPEDFEIGSNLEVFVYRDSEDRLIATTQRPKAVLGAFACLPVVDVSNVGAFLDWGLDKHLFVPFREQPTHLEINRYYFVRVYLDEKTDRLVGTANINRFLSKKHPPYAPNDEVSLLIGNLTDLGYEVIVDSTFRGLVYQNEVFEPLPAGLVRKGFIKNIREDGKLDISLQKPGFAHVSDSAQKVMDILAANDGFLPLNDKSTPEEIVALLQMSKKVFKKAIGTLYKQRAIIITANGIRLA